MQKNLAEKNKRRPFGWVWTAAGVQPKLEAAFDVGGFGFPALVAINAKKKKFATLRGAYSETSVQDFVNRLVSLPELFPMTLKACQLTEHCFQVAGRQPTSPFLEGELPEPDNVAAWDGKDAPKEEFEEEFDLSDLDDVELEDNVHEEL